MKITVFTLIARELIALSARLPPLPPSLTLSPFLHLNNHPSVIGTPYPFYNTRFPDTACQEPSPSHRLQLHFAGSSDSGNRAQHRSFLTILHCLGRSIARRLFKTTYPFIKYQPRSECRSQYCYYLACILTASSPGLMLHLTSRV